MILWHILSKFVFSFLVFNSEYQGRLKQTKEKCFKGFANFILHDGDLENPWLGTRLVLNLFFHTWASITSNMLIYAVELRISKMGNFDINYNFVQEKLWLDLIDFPNYLPFSQIAHSLKVPLQDSPITFNFLNLLRGIGAINKHIPQVTCFFRLGLRKKTCDAIVI